MSQENLETVRRIIDAYLRGDIAEALTNVHPEGVYKPAEEAPAQGRDAIADSLSRWQEDWEELETIPGDPLGAGDHVFVPVRFRGRGRGSGIEVGGEYYEVLTVRDGEVVLWEEFTDRAAALKAAGLSE